jgi:hypothetical protein
MERVKHWNRAAKFLIGYSPRPPLSAINSTSAPEFIVIDRHRNHFSRSCGGFVLIRNRLSSVSNVVTLVREFSLEHVERHSATIRRNFFAK